MLGIAFAGSVLSHQVLDMLWTLPAVWFFPLNGMFPFTTGSGTVWHFLMLELTNPSEWVFALASGILVIRWFMGNRVFFRPSFLSSRHPGLLLYGFSCLLCVTGAFLIITGMNPASAPFPALSYEPDKTLVAGFIALCGAYVFV
jgi:hypothetical protein